MLSLGLVSTNLKYVKDAFFGKNLIHQLKDGEMPQRYTDSYSRLKISKHMGLSFKSHLILKVAVWLSGITLGLNNSVRMVWFEYGQIIIFFFYLLWFFYCLLEKFWLVCFLLKVLLNISFILYFMFILKQNTIYIYMNMH